MRFSHGVVPLFLFLCVFVWSCYETVHCQAQSLPQSELKALEKIGVKLGKSWNVTVDPCSGAIGWVDPNSNWEVAVNVTCGACKTDYCHVISIILTGQNLTGSLPTEFSILTSLKVIDLNRNYLNGTIPASWVSIPLTHLILTGNRMTGRIPDEFGRITTLQYLSLASNMIEDPLPQTLGNLINLRYLGYMAPEYAMRGYLTDKADVYSFGIVILETISGLSNVNFRPKEDCVHLLDCAYILQEQGRLVELVDKSLGPNYSHEEAVMLLNLALTCTTSSPSLRPIMPAVVNIIKGKRPMPVLSRKDTGSNSGLNTCFEAFEIHYNNNSHLVSSLTYHEPCMESSVTTNVEEEEDTWISSTSKLMSDYSY